jgi:hypothetical protein
VPQKPPRAADTDLLAFPSETDASHSPMPPPAGSAVDALLEFASDTGCPQSSAQPPALHDFYVSERVDEPGAFIRMRLVPVRWVLPSAAAFLVGAVSMLVLLREQEANRPGVDATAPSIARAVPAEERASRSNGSKPVLIFDPSAAPGVVAGTPALRDLHRSLPEVRSEVPAVMGQSVPRPRSTTPPTPISTTSVRQSERPVAFSGQTLAALPTVRPAGPAIDTTPIAPLVPSARRADLPEAIVVDVPGPAAPAVEHAALTTTAGDESAVRRALRSYEAAYETLNVAAAAEVWPSVDRQKLARAFATLKSQGLDFQSCNIDVKDGSATAYCRGTYEYVRKVGNPSPLVADQQWTFRMRRAGGTWKIDDVNASQAPTFAAQRTRGQG